MKCCKCKMDYPMSAMLGLTATGEKKYLCVNCWGIVCENIKKKETQG